MSNEDLRPCPFCGNTSVTVLGELPASYRPDLHEASTSLVQCGNCKATAKGKQRWNDRVVAADTTAKQAPEAEGLHRGPQDRGEN